MTLLFDELSEHEQHCVRNHGKFISVMLEELAEKYLGTSFQWDMLLEICSTDLGFTGPWDKIQAQMALTQGDHLYVASVCLGSFDLGGPPVGSDGALRHAVLLAEQLYPLNGVPKLFLGIFRCTSNDNSDITQFRRIRKYLCKSGLGQKHLTLIGTVLWSQVEACNRCYKAHGNLYQDIWRRTCRSLTVACYDNLSSYEVIRVALKQNNDVAVCGRYAVLGCEQISPKVFMDVAR